MSGVKSDFTARVSSPRTTAPPSTTDGMRPGSPSHRSAPRGGGESMQQATTSDRNLVPSQRSSKRFSFIQGLNKSIEVGDLPSSPRAMLEHKVNQLFAQLDQLHEQHLIDQRKGTTQVYTLPEFFWNNFGSNLSESDKEHLLALLQDKIQDPKYEHAIFELGTIMTTNPPEHMARVQPQHLSIVADALAMAEPALEQALTQSMSTDYESFDQGVSRERIALTATASLAASRSENSDAPFSPQQIREAAQDVRLFQDNQVPLAMLTSFANPDALEGKVEAFIASKDMSATKELLTQFCPNIDTSRTRDVRKLQEFMKAHCDNPRSVLAAMQDYKEHYLPFTLTSTASARKKPTAGMLQRRPELNYLTKTQNMFQLHQKGRQMFKPIHNQAVILGGGTTEPRLVSKFAPSEIDVPGYQRAKPDPLDPPSHPESFRQLPGGITPAMPEKVISKQLTRAGHKVEDQIVAFPSENTTLGTVVCRDIESQRFGELPERTLATTEMFQLISAGIDGATFRSKAPTVPVISQNDGIDVRAEVLFGTSQSTLHQQTYEQSESSPTFRPIQGPPRHRHFPGAPSGMWRISDTLHRGGAPDSSTEGSDDNLALDRTTLSEQIATYERDRDVITDKLTLLAGTAKSAVEDRNFEALSFLKQHFKIPLQLENNWKEGRTTGPAVLAHIKQGLDGDLNAAESMLARAQTRLQSLPPQT